MSSVCIQLQEETIQDKYCIASCIQANQCIPV